MQVGFGAIFRLAGPLFLANLAIIASGTIDTLMAGRLAPAELAGVALGMAIASWISVSLCDILQGLSPIAGYHYGAKAYREVGLHLYHNLYLSLALAVPGVILTALTKVWIPLSGMQGEAALVATHYLWLSALALPAILLSRAFVFTNSAVNRPSTTMLVTLILLLFKVPLNGIFMYGWLGVPALGGAGAALSSVVLCWIGLGLYHGIWHRDAYYAPMQLAKLPRPTWSYLKAQLKVGLPMGMAGCFEITAFSAMTFLVAPLGDVVVGAHQIVANLVYIVYVFPFTVGIAGTVLVSQSLGAQKPHLGHVVTRRILGICTVASLGVGALIYGLQGPILRLYTNEPLVMACASTIMVFAAIYHVVDALQISATSLLRGYQITFLPMLIHAFMLCGVALSVGTLLAYKAGPWGEPLGVMGYWIGACVGLGAASVAIVPLALYVARKKAI